MKFSLAAGILVQTVAVTSSVEKSSPTADDVDHIKNNLQLWSRGGRTIRQQRVHQMYQKKYAASLGSSSLVERDTAPTTAIKAEQPVLRNSDNNNLRPKHECDPTSSDPDVGVLSCGFGRYCQESTASDLGGICASDRAFDDNAPIDMQSSGGRRDLQGGDRGEYFQSFCDPSSPFYDQCDCSNFNTVTGQGQLECLITDNFCFDEAATTCSSVVLKSDFMVDGTYEATFCYYFFTPYEQDVCYMVNYFDATCELQFNDVTCASCTVQNSTQVDPMGNPEYCFDFNCTNTEGMHYGSECDGDYVATILELLVNPVCLVCPGDAPVSNPDTMLGDTTCAGVQELGREGGIAEENCVTTQAAVQVICGCESGPTPAPVTPAPTDAPVPAPVTPAPTFEICIVCPGDEPVTDPDEIIDLPNGSFTCGELQESGRSGLIEPDICLVAEGSVPLVCGCGIETPAPVEPTDAPVAPPPTEAPVEPTDAPVAPTESPTADPCIICLNDDDVTNPDNIIAIPGQPEITCAELQAFGRQGLIPAEQCIPAQAAAPFLCGCGDTVLTFPPTAAPTCIVCPDDVNVTNPEDIIVTPGQPNVTCAEVQESGREGLIADDQCIAAQVAIPILCGCGEDTMAPVEMHSMSMSMPSSMPSVSLAPSISTAPSIAPSVSAVPSVIEDTTCIVCPGDEPVTNPDLLVGMLTCEEIQEAGRDGSIPPDQCPGAQGAVPILCGCGRDETDAPVDVPPAPTDAPVEMSMLMNVRNRELDELLDNEFGQPDQETEDDADQPTLQSQQQHVRKRL